MSWSNIGVNNRKPNRSIKMASSGQIMKLARMCNNRGYRLKVRMDIPLYILVQLIDYLEGDIRATRPKGFDTYIDDNGWR